jgi:hypothetical protein
VWFGGGNSTGVRALNARCSFRRSWTANPSARRSGSLLQMTRTDTNSARHAAMANKGITIRISYMVSSGGLLPINSAVGTFVPIFLVNAS